MLSHGLMGAFALGVLWVNTLLVVAAALGSLRTLLRHAASGRVRPPPWSGLVTVSGQVVETTGPALAEHRVEQVGRRASDDASRRAILFHDRRHDSLVMGGVVKTDAGTLLGVPAADRAEVWAAPPDAGHFSPNAFEDAYRQARCARGFERTLVRQVGDGDRVWVTGVVEEGESGRPVLRAPPGGALRVASLDPRRHCRRLAVAVAAFVIGTLAAAGAITTLVLVPPLFGPASTVGGALGLAFFLLVQPAGVWVRDLVKVPSEATVRGSWVQHGTEGQGGPAADDGRDHPPAEAPISGGR